MQLEKETYNIDGRSRRTLNGMSAGNMAFVVKQLNSLAPNVMFVTSGQHGFHDPSGPPTIIINSQVVKRIKGNENIIV